MIEIWKDIKGYEGMYQASTLGNIKSLDRIVKAPRFDIHRKERILRPSINDGYYQVVLQNQSKLTRKIHRLVAETFIPNPDNLPEINHKNGNKKDNSVENLEWCSRRSNIDHACETGLMGKGEELPFSKLTNAAIPVIRDLFASGFTFDDIAPRFGVDRKTIIDVINKRTWKHIL